MAEIIPIRISMFKCRIDGYPTIILKIEFRPHMVIILSHHSYHMTRRNVTVTQQRNVIRRKVSTVTSSIVNNTPDFGDASPCSRVRQLANSGNFGYARQ